MDRPRVRTDVQLRSFEEELLPVDEGNRAPRTSSCAAPVVTVMAMSTTAKTSLLDAIRETRVAGA